MRFDGEDLTRRALPRRRQGRPDPGARGPAQVFPNLSVRENLELGAFTRARERRAANLERVFAHLPAPARAHRASTPAP